MTYGTRMGLKTYVTDTTRSEPRNLHPVYSSMSIRYPVRSSSRIHSIAEAKGGWKRISGHGLAQDWRIWPIELQKFNATERPFPIVLDHEQGDEYSKRVICNLCWTWACLLMLYGIHYRNGDLGQSYCRMVWSGPQTNTWRRAWGSALVVSGWFAVFAETWVS
jgi:hypothetical protein